MIVTETFGVEFNGKAARQFKEMLLYIAAQDISAASHGFYVNLPVGSELHQQIKDAMK